MNSFPLPGAPVFHRNENGALMIEDLGLDELAQEHGTPLFVYSQAAIESALSAWQRGLAGRDALVCYAVKANSSQAILSLLAQAGCGFDIVSGGELARALAAGAEPEKIVFSGVGKTRREMQAALEAGIGCFNVESEAELLALNDVAAACGLTAPVSIRVNPDVDARTHPYISTGLRDNKFGIAHDHALAACQLAASLPGLRVAGIGCHIGSQITEAAPYLDALERVLNLLEAIEAAGVPLGQIDLGGGLGIAYADETGFGSDRAETPKRRGVQAARSSQFQPTAHYRRNTRIRQRNNIAAERAAFLVAVATNQRLPTRPRKKRRQSSSD